MRFSHTLKLVAAGALVVMLAGCGSDGGPTALTTPLDTTAPQAPTGVQLASVGSDVVLRWAPNSEPDLARYEVYMYSPGTPGDNTDVSVALVVNRSEWRLPMIGEAWYRVRAVDTAGNRSAPSVGIYANVPVQTADPVGDPDDPDPVRP